MAFLVRTVLFASLSILAFGQRHAGPGLNPGGYGRSVFPRNEAPPPAGNITEPAHRWSGHPNPSRNSQPNVVIVPFATYGYADPGVQTAVTPDPAQAVEPPPEAAPLRPDPDPYMPPQGIPRTGDATCWESVRAEPVASAPVEEAHATIFLIALKSDTIVEALGYWLEAGTLHYVSAGYGLNQVSLTLVDLAFTQRLNDERGLKFDLPSPK